MAIIIDTINTSPQLQQMLGSGPGLPPALPNYPAQSVTTVDGRSAALFGLPFLAAGTFLGLEAFNVIRTERQGPIWLMVLIGAMFFSAGLFLFLHGVNGMIRKSVYIRKSAETPDQPWLFDSHWHPQGIQFSAFNTMLGRLVGALVWNLFLVPFFGLATRNVAHFSFLLLPACLHCRVFSSGCAGLRCSLT